MPHEISVIIPIYNGVNYISRLVRQLQHQTFRDFETVFVDDGSTDGSRTLLDRVPADLAPKILCERNMGQGAARDTGLRAADGRYVVFMDQDDRIKPDYLEKLHETIVSQDAYLVLSGYKLVSEEGSVRETVFLPNTEWARYMCMTPWAKIYRRDFLVDHGITFRNLVLGEDIYFNFLVYLNIDREHKKIYTMPDYAGYGWTENQASFSRTKHRTICEETDISSLFRAMEGADPQAGEILKTPAWSYFLLKTAVYHILYEIKANELSDIIRYKNRVMGEIQRISPNVLKNPYIRIGFPKGEKFVNTVAVKLFAVSRRLKLENLLLGTMKALKFLT